MIFTDWKNLQKLCDERIAPMLAPFCSRVETTGKVRNKFLGPITQLHILAAIRPEKLIELVPVANTAFGPPGNGKFPKKNETTYNLGAAKAIVHWVRLEDFDKEHQKYE